VSETDFDDAGWFLQASWVLTGEQGSYKQVVPINAFDPRNGRWGAFELAGRVSRVQVDRSVFEDGFASQAGGSTSKATAFTGGLNWYLNRNFKVQFNYEHTDFDQNLPLQGADRGGEDVILTQFQISY
jgi:phosphate-selective porin OprO/OprP